VISFVVSALIRLGGPSTTILSFALAGGDF
jgi:hypothetical protein